MKVYIAFDMEGVTGVAYNVQVEPDSTIPRAYQRAQRFATDDVKAAIEGILEIDPKAEIWVNDGHGGPTKCMSVLFEELPENVQAVVGSIESMDQVMGLDSSFDALVFIGAHGNEQTADAVLCHVWELAEVKFDQRVLSEPGLCASLAGYYGVPLVAMSGDEASMKAIQQELSPKIATAIVKRGIGRYSAICLHPKKSQKLIKEAVIDGLKRHREIPKITYKNPITVEITFKDQYGAYQSKLFRPDDERLSATKIRFTAKDAKEAYIGLFERKKLSTPRHNSPRARV